MPVTNYIWDSVDDNVIMETDGANNATATYTHEPGIYGGLISQRRGSSTSYYHYDGLGSTRELTDDSETVTDTNLCDAWGVNVDSTGSTENNYRWNGRSGYYYDAETSEYYVRARVYKPAIGRWLSVDPLGFVDGLNLFTYVSNSLINSIDMSGYITVNLLNDSISDRETSTGRGKCGRFQVYWNFILDAPAPVDGAIIQHVVTKLWIQSCPWYGCCKLGPNPDESIEFWEAFPVSKGNTRMDGFGFVDVDMGSGWDNSSVSVGSKVMYKRDDKWANKKEHPDTCGRHVTVGYTKFYPMDKQKGKKWGYIGEFRPPRWPGPRAKSSGDAPSTTTEPVFWKSPAIEVENKVGLYNVANAHNWTKIFPTSQRSVYSRWNCCNSYGTGQVDINWDQRITTLVDNTILK